MITQKRRQWSWLGGALFLALLAAGCGNRDAKLEAMAARLEGGSGIGPNDGPQLGFRYWVDQNRTRETSVRQTLIDIGARLHNGEVIDPEGRVLYFWHVMEYTHPRDRQWQREVRETVERLEKRYRLIRMYVGEPKN